jgi:adenine-specific DNA-methyltransferase
MKVAESLFDYLRPDIEYEIKKSDSLTVLKKIEDAKFDLILTSPYYKSSQQNTINASFRTFHFSH